MSMFSFVGELEELDDLLCGVRGGCWQTNFSAQVYILVNSQVHDTKVSAIWIIKIKIKGCQGYQINASHVLLWEGKGQSVDEAEIISAPKKDTRKTRCNQKSFFKIITHTESESKTERKEKRKKK